MPALVEERNSLRTVSGGRAYWSRVLRVKGNGMMDHPTPLDAERLVEETRAMFGRTIAIWASQLLEINRTGMRSPTLGSVPPFADADDWSIAA